MGQMNRRGVILFYAAAAVFSARLLLAMTGVTGVVNADLPGLATPAYLLPALAHSLYGVLLFGIVIATGTGFLQLCRRLIVLNDDDVDILGLPAGLLVCLGLALLCCLGTTGRLVAALVVAAAIGDWCRRRCSKLTPSNPRPVFVILLALLFGTHLAFMWVPTTAFSTGAIGLGDITTYAAWYHSLKVSLLPLYNLAAEGDLGSYFNNLHSFYALALDLLPYFDIYLFILASLSTFYVLSIAYMLHVLTVYRSHCGYPALTPGNVTLVVVILIAAARYPGWILESPPAVFLAPVALAVMYAVARAGENPSRLGFALALALAGSATSKVVSLAVLGAYTGLKLLHVIMRRASMMQFLWLGMFGIAIAAYVAYMVGNFGNLILTEWVPGPESWQRFEKKGWSEFHQVIPVLLKDVGLLLIVVGTFKLGDWALVLTVILAVLSNFLFSFLFYPTPVALLLLIAAWLLTTREVPRGAARLLLTGALLFVPHHIRHDPGEWQMVLLWAATLGGSALLVLSYHAQASGDQAGKTGNRKTWRQLAIVFLVGSLSLSALATGDFRLGKKRIVPVAATLYDIWTNTRQRTPPDALIFTDQTGNDTGRLGGWNDYSTMAQRQFYISSWSVSTLRYVPGTLEQRLLSNEAVLTGKEEPGELSLSRGYTGYYAVVAGSKTMPANFHELYRNSDYALYEIR
ncbi:MAG: hypothetical protein WBN57_12565 [Gammaproteobacteria bacterium]